MALARGIRNHNPGNVERTSTTWQGMAEDQSDPRFIVFRRPWWGIRAMCIILKNYQVKHGIRTVDGIIKRWAPDSDNNPTAAYVRSVCAHLDVAHDQIIDLTDVAIMRKLVAAVIKFENGTNPYTWEIDTGLVLAGMEPEVAYT